MAPRAYWKGYLKLSLVSCPIALFPATSDREKISFHQLNKSTGHRIKYRKVDAETGDEVDSADIIKGYEVGKGDYIELDPEELEAVAIESKRTIDIEEFVPKDEIDELYLNNPYYIAPDGEVGQQAFAVIREAIRKEGMVAIARLCSRRVSTSLRLNAAAGDYSASRCVILTRFGTKPTISMIFRMRRSPRTCSSSPRTS
jgi:DNA end-binding protein Ku